MLLFKFKKNSEINAANIGSFNDFKLPVVRPLAAFIIVILGGLCWVPSFLELQAQTQALQLEQQRLLSRNHKVKSLLEQVAKPAWLASYPWLTWYTKSQSSRSGSHDQLKKSSPRLLTFSLQGIASYQEWAQVLNRLLDSYPLQTTFEQIDWQVSGLLDVSLELQLVPKKQALKQYQLFPRRVVQSWPDNIEVLAALKWQDKRSLKVNVDLQTLSLAQGDWVPELAADLILLDDKKAVFRQQSTSFRLDDSASNELELTYLNGFKLDDVMLTKEDDSPSYSTAKTGLAVHHKE